MNKARGKDIKTGEWVSGYFAVLHIARKNNHDELLGYDESPHIFNDEPGQRGKGGYWHTIDEATLGYESPWKDSNGQTIYEGDIVSLTIPDGTRRNFLVRLDTDDRLLKEKPGFIHDGNPVRICGWFFEWNGHLLLPTVHKTDGNGECDYERMKVIGNIHDNPEKFYV